MKLQSRPYLVIILILFAGLLMVGCQGSKSQPTPTPFIEPFDGEIDQFIGIPNPASFYCQEMGYQLELKDSDDGTEGICRFPDGKECEEWDFLSGSCAIEWSFCQRQGYRIREGDGMATCVFPDDSTCPEYDFFIRECDPPQN